MLVDAVDSPRLSRLYQGLSGEIHLSMVQSRYALGRDRIVAEHDGVLAALRAGEVDRATELMRAHLEGARDALAAQLDRRATG
jgi:DNA-binding GntR family transcriptional regulator